MMNKRWEEILAGAIGTAVSILMLMGSLALVDKRLTIETFGSRDKSTSVETQALTATTTTSTVPAITATTVTSPTEISLVQMQEQINHLVAQMASLHNAMTVTSPTEISVVQRLQEHINRLVAEITSLSNTMVHMRGKIDGSACDFGRDLTIGDKGDDVRCLQAYLTETSWPGKLAVTGYFDENTRTALAQWQVANGLVPADGYFEMGSMVTYSHLTTQGKG